MTGRVYTGRGARRELDSVFISYFARCLHTHLASPFGYTLLSHTYLGIDISPPTAGHCLNAVHYVIRYIPAISRASCLSSRLTFVFLTTIQTYDIRFCIRAEICVLHCNTAVYSHPYSAGVFEPVGSGTRRLSDIALVIV